MTVIVHFFLNAENDVIISNTSFFKKDRFTVRIVKLNLLGAT